MNPRHSLAPSPDLASHGSGWWATWIAGPDCGTTVALGDHGRRWLVGSTGSAVIRCDDPALAAHHAVVEMCPAGAATGRAHGEVPRVVVLAAPPTAANRAVTVAGSTPLGHSVLAVHRSAPPPAVVRPDGMVRRRARPRRPVPVPPQEPAGLNDPPDGPGSDSAPAALALISSAVGLVVAVVMAVVLAQPMFAWFALSGAVVAVAGWAAQRWWHRRRQRRDRDARRRQRVEHEAALAAHRIALRRHTLATTPTVPRAWNSVIHGDAHLWERRRADTDSFVVGLGALSTEVGHLTTDLAISRRIAVTGPRATDALRGLLLQLVAQCGPADLRLVAVTHEPSTLQNGGGPDRLSGLPADLGRLPHGVECAADELAEVLAHETTDDRHVLVVTDLADQLAIRTSPLRRALDAHPGVSLVCVHPGPPPLLCTAELATDDSGRVTWTPDRAAPSERQHGLLTGVGAARWATAVAVLGWLTDPEDDAGARQLPDTVDLADVIAFDPDAVASRWNDGSSRSPRAALGSAADGLVAIDLVRDGPHALVVGTTGSGKSELLRTFVVGLASATPPDLLQFVLVDFKGGAAFDACARLPHVVGLVTDLDASGCERVVRSLRAELRRREATLRSAGVADVADLHGGAFDRETASEVPRLVVVIDEFAVLAQELPDVLHSLVDIARRGRSLGVHLVLATQRATGILSDDIRANTALRIALRLHDHTESRDIVGDDSAARLPRRTAGRAVVRLGDDERIVFQSAYSAPVLAQAVDVLAQVAVDSGRRPLRRPWCEPLPSVLPAGEPGRCGDGALGLIDDTEAQRQRPLHWAPEAGGLLLLGGPRTGHTSTLDLLERHVAGQVGVRSERHVAGPAGGRSAGRVALAARAVVRIDASLDEVALHRALGEAAGDSDAVLMVDRFDLIRSALERDGREVHLEMLVHALVRQHCVVVSASSLAAVPGAVLHRLTARWAARVSDPFELQGLGVRPDDNPPGVPGRIVITAGPDAGMHAQLALVNGPTTRRRRGGRRDADPTSASTDPFAAGTDPFSVGTDTATGTPVGLCAELGEHLLVTGSRRSGRTTALRAISAAWSALQPEGVVVMTGGREARRALDESWATAAHDCLDQPTLLAIDDADAIDDDPALRALLETRSPLLTVAIAVDPAGLRGRYGHWTLEVRRHRTGLALLGGDDDGDAWGIVLPRRLPLSPAPGRALVIRRGIVDESLGPRIITIATPPD